MNKNIGKFDKIFRLSAGFILIVISVILGVSGLWPIIFLIVGALLIFTALVSFCPLYTVFGMSTCKKD